MAIPPFPSHDLAKLVLGYLAEEQLMTAYDEFLQTSPYLDVLRNEFDRIFMTSLKTILAEYRAVKIYVETCKPFLLRKKLFQCSNLLEIVKFLVTHVDINRLQAQESSADKTSYIKQSSFIKRNGCEVCYSLHLSTCECRPRGRQSQAATCKTTGQSEGNSDTSIEATSLADLPGSSTTKRNPKRESTEVAQSSIVHEPQTILVQPVVQRGVSQQISQSSLPQQMPRPPAMEVAYMGVQNQNQSVTSVRPTSVQHFQNAGVEYSRQDGTQVKSDEAKQKMEEFNSIYSLVCGNNSSSNVPITSNVVAHNCSNTPISSTGSFQDFAAGVDCNKDKEKPIVPDSSTSENFSTQIKENRTNSTPIANIKGPPVTQYFMRATTMNSPYYTNQSLNCMPKVPPVVRIKEKEDPKVTIISDVKVDPYKTYTNNTAKMPQVLRNHSNPMLQMQTIFINGTPAYTNKTGQNFAFTKDEIMAMPTIIVVPSSGLTHTSSATYCQSNISSASTTTTTTNATPRVLGPLVIDVNSPTSKKSTQLPDLGSEEPELVSKDLVKTVDASAVSLPKDANTNVPNKTSTPNALPPTRKSSSTPRRNSHVRVLDFATPRRILHETLNENDPNQQPKESNTENVSNGPTDKAVHTNIITNNKYDTPQVSNKSKHTKENKKLKKSNWDAELRALAVVYEEPVATPKPKVKKAKKKKKVSPKTCLVEQVSETLEADSTKTTHSTSHTTTKSNESLMSVDNVEHSIKEITSNVTQAKTTAKSKNESEGSTSELHLTNKSQNEVNNSDDTPEIERLALQNVIGAKLNISEFLETPYKQALYDIQMETPKFLGPDLPGEPISDIKIMSIPTPRFLNTPRQQSTPSYACRTTDYSSGSSYYKPDDHDYIPSDVLQCTNSETETGDTKKLMSKEPIPEQTKEKEKSEKPRRPQRKCTKNVSYRNLAKMKDDDSFEAASGSSDNSYKSMKDKKVNKSVDSKARMKSKLKSISKKNVISYKSPQKPFMKIKPRRPTPSKESSSKGRRKSEGVIIGASNPRKRTTSKDQNTNITPIVVAAPTKSRRKSSTPRKLHCTEKLSSETVVQTTCIMSANQQVQETIACHLQDSDTEQLALRWSDDGSQDAKPKEKEEQATSSSLHDEEDIAKIKEYIEAPVTLVIEKTSEVSLHVDLIKRGFDAETAKIIERDLLDATPIQDTAIQSTSNEEITVENIDQAQTVSDKIDSDASIANNLKRQEEYEVEDVELSVNECNEDSKNYITCHFDESKHVPCELSKLKDKFSMELCIDDDLTIRLRSNQFTSLLDMDPEEFLAAYSPSETEDAVTSISNFDKLYTPMKDSRAKCYEIFESTLTSIDTPLKSDVIHERQVTETEIIVEVESVKEEVKEKTEIKKRKRLQSVSLDDSLGKKPKPDAEYLLNSANIQDIDIDAVLYKLHG